MERKKTVIFLRSGYDEASDPRMEKEIAALVESGYEVQVVAWDRSSNGMTDIIVSIKGKKIKFFLIGIKGEYGVSSAKTYLGMVFFNLKLLYTLVKKRKEYSIIHACDFDTVIPGFLVAKFLKKKLIYDIFDYYADSHYMPNVLASIIRKVDTYVINKSNAVIICNEARKKQIVPAKPKQLEVVHNTPQWNENILDDLSISRKEKEEVVKIVYVGRLEASGRYIKEMVDVIAEDSRFEMHLGGSGPLRDYIEYKSSCSSNITYLGNMVYDKVLQLEASCDVMTAIYDPTLKNHKYAAPNKFYEALMLGKPLVVMQNTGIDISVKEQGLGWVIPEDGDFVVAFKSILNQIYEERLGLVNYREPMKEIYNSSYRWEIMKDRLIHLYEEIGKDDENQYSH